MVCKISLKYLVLKFLTISHSSSYNFIRTVHCIHQLKSDFMWSSCHLGSVPWGVNNIECVYVELSRIITFNSPIVGWRWRAYYTLLFFKTIFQIAAARYATTLVSNDICLRIEVGRAHNPSIWFCRISTNIGGGEIKIGILWRVPIHTRFSSDGICLITTVAIWGWR